MCDVHLVFLHLRIVYLSCCFCSKFTSFPEEIELSRSGARTATMHIDIWRTSRLKVNTHKGNDLLMLSTSITGTGPMLSYTSPLILSKTSVYLSHVPFTYHMSHLPLTCPIYLPHVPSTSHMSHLPPIRSIYLPHVPSTTSYLYPTCLIFPQMSNLPPTCPT